MNENDIFIGGRKLTTIRPQSGSVSVTPYTISFCFKNLNKFSNSHIGIVGAVVVVVQL
jgi:hypothetical protein